MFNENYYFWALSGTLAHPVPIAIGSYREVQSASWRMTG
jgi:hypothetical protein